VNLGLSVVLIPVWGINGNALATLVGAVVTVFLYCAAFRHFSGLGYGEALLPSRVELVRLYGAYQSRQRVQRSTS
jgi:O-antigen/teichoic acid export membrane protein